MSFIHSCVRSFIPAVLVGRYTAVLCARYYVGAYSLWGSRRVLNYNMQSYTSCSKLGVRSHRGGSESSHRGPGEFPEEVIFELRGCAC